VSAQSIVGSWEELVRFPPGVPISQQIAVMTFPDDKTVLSSGQGSLITNSMKNAQVESDGKLLRNDASVIAITFSQNVM
jgi:hypothetical protein